MDRMRLSSCSPSESCCSIAMSDESDGCDAAASRVCAVATQPASMSVCEQRELELEFQGLGELALGFTERPPVIGRRVGEEPATRQLATCCTVEREQLPGRLHTQTVARLGRRCVALELIRSSTPDKQ